jgi:hypothetical protein
MKYGVPRILARVLLGFLLGALPAMAQTLRVVHIFVALADNQHQGIVPVPAGLGNGGDPIHNLYWGAAFGVKTTFQTSQDWERIPSGRSQKAAVLDRCVFRHRKQNVIVVADAYEGGHIREAVTDFLSAAAGGNAETLALNLQSGHVSIPIGGASDLVTYVGHDAFMDFQVSPISGKKANKPREAIILACASKPYFGPYLKQTGAEPLLWTTGLMAPEAYTLKAALDGWIAREDHQAIRQRSAQAYDRYQKCGMRAALRLFATGW